MGRPHSLVRRGAQRGPQGQGPSTAGRVMKLAEVQRTFFDLIRQPLTATGGQRAHTLDGRPVRTLADMLVTPGPRLAPFQRLELYSQGYWIRLLRVLREDFAGLRELIGRPAFERLV